MTPTDLATAQRLVKDFRRALAVVRSTPKPAQPYCECDHHETAHPLDRYGAHPCLAGPCDCADFREAP